MQWRIFANGFRPTFLVAGLAALSLIPAWVAVLFGFVGAAIAGFLLTAVPSRTAQRGFAGLPYRPILSRPRAEGKAG